MVGETPDPGGPFTVNLVTRRLRSLLIALAVLALSAWFAILAERIEEIR